MITIDEDGPGVPPTLPPLSLRMPRDLFPRPPYTPGDTGDDDEDLNHTQCFLLQRHRAGGKRLAEAIGQELTRTTPQRVTFSENVTCVFPKSQKIMEKMDDITEKLLGFSTATASDPDLSEMQAAARELSRGKVPQALKFFSGGEKEGAELLAHARKRVGWLSDENEAFLTYVTSSVLGRQLLTRNKIKIHIKSGNFFIDNVCRLAKPCTISCLFRRTTLRKSLR